MSSSWWNKEFTSPVIMIAECEDTQERLSQNPPRKCKSKEEINEFY
jgi:hypothetical protein